MKNVWNDSAKPGFHWRCKHKRKHQKFISSGNQHNANMRKNKRKHKESKNVVLALVLALMLALVLMLASGRFHGEISSLVFVSLVKTRLNSLTAVGALINGEPLGSERVK